MESAMANPSGVLPEDKNWHDTGCSIAPACLSCPLPACRYDMPAKVAGMIERVPLILELQEQGLTQREIGERLGVSRRGVQRSLSAARR